MANYTLKELKEKSTEKLILILALGVHDESKANRKKEEWIFKILDSRGIINYDDMEKYIRNIIYGKQLRRKIIRLFFIAYYYIYNII